MNFEREITEAYKEIGMIPINGQEKAVDRILTAFIIDKKRNCILSADTGTGKSIIATVVSIVFKNHFMNKGESGCLPATIAVHSNMLVNQYADTFEDYSKDKVLQVMGKSNYPCSANIALNDDLESHTAESCFYKGASISTKKDYCDACVYKEVNEYKNNTELLITNYSYKFISSMWTNVLAMRKINIFDEAHTINEVFCQFISITVSTESISKDIELCAEYPYKNRENHNTLTEIKRNLLNGIINESNYVSTLKKLITVYSSLSDNFDDMKKKLSPNDSKVLSKEDNALYSKYKKLEAKYKGSVSKIEDLFEYEYTHVFDDSVQYAFTIKPIFMGDMSKNILGEYNLFMSATISDTYMYQTMNLKKEDTAYIVLDTVYEPTAKQVLFCSNNKLNMQSLKSKNVVNDLTGAIHDIVESATIDGHKGIILTPSFMMGDLIKEHLPKNVKIFNHSKGQRISDIIDEFKGYKKPSVLISPSIFEGVDFSDDYSRYQILVKAPFPSLGDKRVAYIANNYPDVYKIMTLMKIVQGLGRSCRNKDDYSISFIMDKNIELLFYSHLNVWRNQFYIS